MLKQANLSFSVAAQSFGDDVTAIQFSTLDRNTAKLAFTIKNGKQPLNLTNVEAKVDLVMGDKSVFDDNIARVISPEEGKIEYTITPEQIRHPGRARGELQLTSKDGQSLGGFRFNFTVKKALVDEMAGPVKEYYVQDLEAIKEKAHKKLEEIEAISGVDISRIDTRIDELEGQIGEGVGVDEQARQEIQQVTVQLEDKANKQYVDEQVNNISPKNTTFFTQGVNLFNKDSILLNKTMETDGRIIDDSSRWLSKDFIPVKQGDVISFSGAATYRISLHDADKKFISRQGTTNAPVKYTVTSPTAKFIQISGTTAPETVMVNYGETPLPFEPFKYILPPSYLPALEANNLKDGTVTPEKLTIFKFQNNLFNKSNVQVGKSIDTNGAVIDDPSRWLSSDLIPVSQGDKIHFSGTSAYRIATYTADKSFYSRTGSSSGTPNVYNVSSPVVKFLRLSGTEKVENVMVNKGESLLPYETYGAKLKDEFLPDSSRDINTDNLKQQIINQLASLNAKNPYPSTLELTTAVYEGIDTPYWLSEDGRVLYGNRGSTPLMSKDEWTTRVQIGSTSLPAFINAIRELPNGELLASVNRDESKGIKAKLFKTTGFDKENPSAATWKMVLEAGSTLANIQNSWGIDMYNNIVVVSEYGLQGQNGSRFVYLSTDHGDTFTSIFDLVNQQIEGRPTWTDRAHIHTVAYDPYFSRIWICVGDSTNTAVYYSDDLGVTWKFVEGSNVVQLTGIIALEDSVVFGSDRSPNGLYIYRREGKGDKPKIYPWFIINDEPILTHVFQLPFRRKREKEVPVYFTATTSYPDTRPNLSVVLGFIDSKKANLLYDSNEANNLPKIDFVFGNTAQGNIILVGASGTSSSGRKIFKIKAPDWS